MRAVKVGDAVLVAGEVTWHPVKDDANTALMEIVDQVHQVLRSAIAAGRREEPGALVSPGAVERMLADRQELDVCEVEAQDVVGKSRGHLGVGEPAVSLLGDAHPRTEVDFIDAHGRAEVVALAAGGHPLLIAPDMVEVPDD